MKDSLLLGISIFIWCAPVYSTQYWHGQVVGVTDGDTIIVLIENKAKKVRLAEIDAPEKRQPFGTKSKQSLSSMVFGKLVKVTQTSSDRYGRVVGRVYVGNSDVNAEQIKRGMAWVYKKYARDPSLLTFENRARFSRTGLWSENNPIPPWMFRRSAKSGFVSQSKAAGF